jgi:hypothetical protein
MEKKKNLATIGKMLVRVLSIVLLSVSLQAQNISKADMLEAELYSNMAEEFPSSFLLIDNGRLSIYLTTLDLVSFKDTIPGEIEQKMYAFEKVLDMLDKKVLSESFFDGYLSEFNKKDLEVLKDCGVRKILLYFIKNDDNFEYIGTHKI